MAEQPYANFSGHSGLRAYDLGDDDSAVVLTFSSGKVYTYSPTTHSAAIVTTLRKLCLAGSGVCTYLSQVVGQEIPPAVPRRRRGGRAGRGLDWW